MFISFYISSALIEVQSKIPQGGWYETELKIMIILEEL